MANLKYKFYNKYKKIYYSEGQRTNDREGQRANDREGEKVERGIGARTINGERGIGEAEKFSTARGELMD